MKFWKSILITTATFFTFCGVVMYSACEKDPCTNISCKNGGACKAGVCNCAAGFEGPTCSTQSIDRFIGVFAGYTQCNNGAMTIDTVFMFRDLPKNVTNAIAIQKSHPSDRLTCTVFTTESTYSLLIPDKADTNYRKKYNITLQSDKKMILDTYERDSTTPGNLVVNHCIFTGFKVK